MDYKILMKKKNPGKNRSPRPAFVIENKKSRVLGKIHSLAPGGSFLWKTEDLDPGFCFFASSEQNNYRSIAIYIGTGID
jgi:hypothetical protein